MSLDPAYLEYPRRRAGYDHDLYAYSAMPTRKPITWPGGKGVATWIVVSLEWFPITPSDTPFRAPGHMQTAYPDYRHYTAREYGTRIGFYRLLDAFADGVNARIRQLGPEDTPLEYRLLDRHPTPWSPVNSPRSPARRKQQWLGA